MNLLAPFLIFLLMGQSNMSGRGIMPASVPTNAKVWAFGKDYRVTQATEPSDTGASGAVDAIYTGPLAGGEAYSIATRFGGNVATANPGYQVLLIQCALGGTPITAWTRDLSDSTLYGACMKRARAAHVGQGRYAGVLWLQGEWESGEPTADEANAWGGYFAKMAADLRADMGQARLPIVYGETMSSPSLPWLSIVQAQQASAATQIPGSGYVALSDLTPGNGDHWDTPNLNIIADRFANTWQSLAVPQGIVSAAVPTPTPTPSGALTFTVSPLAVSAGANVNVSWANFATVAAANWFGLYAVGADDGLYLDWDRVGCTKSITTAPANNTCTVPISVSSGNYEFRLFDGATLLKTSAPIAVS